MEKKKSVKQDKNVSFLGVVEKKPLVKKVGKEDDWKKSIYGFECANWTTKC